MEARREIVCFDDPDATPADPRDFEEFERALAVAAANMARRASGKREPRQRKGWAALRAALNGGR